MSYDIDGIISYETDGCLIVPIKDNLSIKEALRNQNLILNKVWGNSYFGVIVDLSELRIIDSKLWVKVLDLFKSIKLMGYRAIIIGLRAGVVASLVDLELLEDNLDIASNLQQAKIRLIP